MEERRKGEMEAKEQKPLEIEVGIKGKAAEAIAILRLITGKPEFINVLISALRIYEWVLAQQAKGCTIVSRCQDESLREELKVKEVALVNYVKDKDLALTFFKGRDVSL